MPAVRLIAQAQTRALAGHPTSAVTTKAGANVRFMWNGATWNGATLISIPLTPYGNHRVNVYARVVTMTRRIVQTFEDSVQGTAPVYTKVIALPHGVYRLEVLVKDSVAGTIAGDTIEFEVK